MKKCTGREKKMIDLYLSGENKKNSYCKAGYATYPTDADRRNQAQRFNIIFNKPHVQAYYQEQLAKLDKENIASAQEIMQFLSDTMRNNNEQTKNRIKCAELLGKKYAMWIEKVEATGDVKVEVEYV